MCYPKDDKENNFDFNDDEIFSSESKRDRIEDMLRVAGPNAPNPGIPWMEILDNGDRLIFNLFLCSVVGLELMFDASEHVFIFSY